MIDLKAIAESRGFRLIDTREDERFVSDERFEACSYLAGDDEIWLGRYQDENLRAASMFHEIGHSSYDPQQFRASMAEKGVMPDEIPDIEECMAPEMHAWKVSRELCSFYNVPITPAVEAYIKKSLQSHRECYLADLEYAQKRRKS